MRVMLLIIIPEYLSWPCSPEIRQDLSLYVSCVSSSLVFNLKLVENRFISNDVIIYISFEFYILTAWSEGAP